MWGFTHLSPGKNQHLVGKKFRENLEKDSPLVLVFSENESLHRVCTEVVLELVHVHQGFVGFPAVTGLAESSPSNLIDSTMNSCSLCWATTNGWAIVSEKSICCADPREVGG